MRSLPCRLARAASVALSAAIGLAACGPARSDSAAAAPVTSVTHPDWSRTAVIYEVNVRQYTPQGTLAAFRQHLPRLDSLGVDILWLMPVQPIGRLNRKGPLGSYYSISDYTAVNPEFGTEADFKAVVDAAHALGMKVILDWVPNHTAFDHHWTRTNKTYYTLRPDGSISVALDREGKETDWTDVAELNYDNRDMRRAMLDEMRWWVREMGIDGFRMDVAWGVPYDFWAETRQALDSVRPGLFLLAEEDDHRLHQWFDMTYGWEYHHILNEVAQGKKGVGALREYFAKQAATFPADAYRMFFTSNHDENSWQGTEFERMGANHMPAFVLSATAANAMPLLYTGQEVANPKRLRFFEKDTVNWSGRSLAWFYRGLFDLKETQPALANGAAGGPQVEVSTDGGDRVYVFSRTRDANTVLVALNFGEVTARVAYRDLPAPGAYRDWFSRENVALGATGTIQIPPSGYRVLVKQQ